MEEDVDKDVPVTIPLSTSFGGIDLQLLGIGNNGHIGF